MEHADPAGFFQPPSGMPSDGGGASADESDTIDNSPPGVFGYQSDLLDHPAPCWDYSPSAITCPGLVWMNLFHGGVCREMMKDAILFNHRLSATTLSKVGAKCVDHLVGNTIHAQASHHSQLRGG